MSNNTPNHSSGLEGDIDVGTLMEDARVTVKDRYKEIRKEVYLFLERPQTKLAVHYHLLNLVLIFGSIFTNIVSTIETFEKNETLNNLLFYYELALLTWFSVEYLVRLWSCSFLGKYKGLVGRIRFTRGLYMMIDAFVILSTLITTILSVQTSYLTMLRVTRFLQIFRILRLDRQRGDLRTMGRVVYKHRKELMSCYFVGFIILFGGTYLIFIVEKSSSENSTINNMANGLYWAMITVTSIGYGDISPETWPGKLLTGIFALVGCAFFALPAGILGSGFALQVAKQKKQLRFVKVRNPAAVVIQTYWRNYTVTNKSHKLQGTWYYFFPKMMGRRDTHEFEFMMPGISTFMSRNLFQEPQPSDSESEVKENGGGGWSRLKMRKKFGLNKNASDGDGSTPSKKNFGFPKPIGNGKGKKKLLLPLSKLLSAQHKNAIRFIVKVKLTNCIKTFKTVRYPFVNVQDIMEKTTQNHTETMSYLKDIQESMSEFRNEIKALRSLVNSRDISTSIAPHPSSSTSPTLTLASPSPTSRFGDLIPLLQTANNNIPSNVGISRSNSAVRTTSCISTDLSSIKEEED